MKITVKTVGWINHHLPGDPADNQAELDVAEGATPEGVITQLALPTDQDYAVEINGALVPRHEHDSRTLAAGDLLAILHVPKVVM
jgi:sulfur carrier protein ThiS